MHQAIIPSTNDNIIHHHAKLELDPSCDRNVCHLSARPLPLDKAIAHTSG
jgi:hypothetical protein